MDIGGYNGKKVELFLDRTEKSQAATPSSSPSEWHYLHLSFPPYICFMFSWQTDVLLISLPLVPQLPVIVTLASNGWLTWS
jgi:hypothetical protein